MTLEESLLMEYRVSQGFYEAPEFLEGIKAYAIDKS
eukprot:CAMPEP_0170549160 /NCGR_PEP_ID=MMETSP0211-20121228/7358_1 /TAXON_ID=311385 /ORGANISM="Pseudokeronopsis sp., Strain OXSARD2" /LENGTH=35 /DNA_ID= /DNA_START= /DNA_END= /DNA_ORIENTATION=